MNGRPVIPQNGPPINHVPVSVIAPLIRNWRDEHAATKGEEGSGYVGPRHDNEGYLGVLGFQSGVSPRTLRMIMNGKKTTGHWNRGSQDLASHITFDMADKIVCATLGPLAWHTEESLIPFYGPLEVTAGELREGRELPEGFDFQALSAEKRNKWSVAQGNRARREELEAA